MLPTGQQPLRLGMESKESPVQSLLLMSLTLRFPLNGLLGPALEISAKSLEPLRQNSLKYCISMLFLGLGALFWGGGSPPPHNNLKNNWRDTLSDALGRRPIRVVPVCFNT